MLRLSLEHLKAGMIIARNVYNANGSLLLGKHQVLDEQVINRLENLNIDAVYVENPLCQIEPAEEVIHEKTRVEAVRFTRNAFDTFRKTQNLNLVGIQQSIQKIIDDLLCSRDVLIHLTDIRVRNDYTFGHSINVCLVAAVIGVKLRFSGQQLLELATGAILHDLGMMLVAPDLVNKKDRLTADEWEVITNHTTLGFDTLRKLGAVPLLSAHVAYQHHESFDGTGYPRGLSGERSTATPESSRSPTYTTP